MSGRVTVRRASGCALAVLALLLSSCDEGSSQRQPDPKPSGEAGEGPVIEPKCFTDEDADGWCDNTYSYVPFEELDCDDRDASRHPAASEVSNAVDDDCDGMVDNGVTSACPLSIDEPASGCETAVTIAAGLNHACLLTDAGRVLCWGMSYLGALGTPELVSSGVPIAVPGIAGASGLAVSGHMTCALVAEHAICWGADSAFPYTIVLPEDTTQIAIGEGLYALDGTGTVWSRPVWPVEGVSPEFAMLASDITQLADGGGTVCGLGSMGELTCWSAGMPTELAVSGVDAVQVGSRGVVCFKQAGELLCNAGGSPAPIAGNGSAVGFDVGQDFACAFDEAGTLACWSPTGPTSVDDAVDLALGAHFGCILRKSGRVSCFGNGDGGVLGEGHVTPFDQPEPVDVLPAPSLDWFRRLEHARPTRRPLDARGSVGRRRRGSGSGDDEVAG